MTDRFAIIDNSALRRPHTVKTFETFTDAKAYAYDQMNVAFFEIDNDHPDCADFITSTATIYAIEPIRRPA